MRHPSIFHLLALSAFALAASIAVLWWLAPILDPHEGTAAWVQAAGAIVIIAATALIASQSSREARERDRIARHQLWESIAVLARNCLGAIDTFLKDCPSVHPSDPRGHFLRAYAPSDFEVPMDGLAEVPLHQVGNAALITAVLTLRGAMGRIKKHLDEVKADQLMSVDPSPVRNLRTPAFNAFASILRIVEGTSAEREISRRLPDPS